MVRGWATAVALLCLVAAVYEARLVRAGSQRSRWWFTAFVLAAAVCTLWALFGVPGWR